MKLSLEHRVERPERPPAAPPDRFIASCRQAGDG
jgi:hypothetical protein